MFTPQIQQIVNEVCARAACANHAHRCLVYTIACLGTRNSSPTARPHPSHDCVPAHPCVYVQLLGSHIHLGEALTYADLNMDGKKIPVGLSEWRWRAGDTGKIQPW